MIINYNYINNYHYVEKARKLEKKGRKKLKSWGLFCNKLKDAVLLFEKAAHFYILANAWDQAGAAYLKLANCHLKLDSKYEAANAYIEAGHAHKKTSEEEATSCLEQAVNIFLGLGKINMAAACCQEIAEIYENDHNFEQAITWNEKAVDLYRSRGDSTSVNLCRLKIAEFAAQMQKYRKAIDIYEDIAREFLNSIFLREEVKDVLLNAGICYLCKGETVLITNALVEYQAMDPTFTGTRECNFFSDLASAVGENDVEKFTAIVREFDRVTLLDPRKSLLLLKVKAKMINPDMDNEDLS